MTSERLVELSMLVADMPGGIEECEDAGELYSKAIACSKIAAELLDALRWRKASEELPEPGEFVFLKLERWAVPHCAQFLEGKAWSHYESISLMLSDDQWLPIPPLPEGS